MIRKKWENVIFSPLSFWFVEMHSQMSCIKCSSKWFTFIYSWWGIFSKYKTTPYKNITIFSTTSVDSKKYERPPTWMNCLEVDHAIYYQYGTDLNVQWRLAPRWILNILCIYLEGPWESIIFLFVLALSIEFHWIAFFYVCIFNCIPKLKLIIMLKNHV